MGDRALTSAPSETEEVTLPEPKLDNLDDLLETLESAVWWTRRKRAAVGSVVLAMVTPCGPQLALR